MGTSKSDDLDDIDERIVWELTRNSRVTNKHLAEVLGIAQSTCLLRIRSLHERGVIKSHHAHPDWGALGLPLQAMVSVRLRAQARAQVATYARRVIALPNVLDVFHVGGTEDFLIHVACSSTAQLRQFIAQELSMDPSVASAQTNIIFEHLNGFEHMNKTGTWVHMEVVPRHLRPRKRQNIGVGLKPDV